jgi:ABC-type microcin C transport system permease subunit YejB
LLADEIKKLTMEHEVSERAKLQNLRRYYKDQKLLARHQIEMLKEQIQYDLNDQYFRELDVEQIRNDFTLKSRKVLGQIYKKNK